MPQIGLLGIGAIGSLMAYHWRNLPVVVLPKIPQRPSHIHLIHHSEHWQAELPVWQGSALTWLVVCTKAAATLPALQSWRALLPQVEHILLIQNGMGQQQQVWEYLQQEGLQAQLWAGCCTEGAYRQGDIVHYAGEGRTQIGRWPSGEPCAKLPPLLPHTEYVDAIAPLLRQKLAINAVINPLTAYYRCLNGELAQQYQPQLSALCAEISALYQALGWTLSQPLFEQALSVANATAANRSSTLQDIEAQRPTELDYICGYLLTQATAIGQPLPLTQELISSL